MEVFWDSMFLWLIEIPKKVDVFQEEKGGQAPLGWYQRGNQNEANQSRELLFKDGVLESCQVSKWKGLGSTPLLGF